MRPPRGTAVSSTSGAPARGVRDRLRPARARRQLRLGASDAHHPRRQLAARAVEQRDGVAGPGRAARRAR
jgi:hypothetical protein